MASPRWRTLLRVPLFHKILIANAAIVVLGAAAGTILTTQLLRRFPERPLFHLVLAFAALGVLVSLAVNAVILWVALTPLRRLQETVARVEGGDLAARAPASPLADAELDRLIHTFNAMLDRLMGTQGRLRETARRALTAQEEERKRIARELHDETAQALIALRVRLEVARRQSERSAREAMLEEIREEIGLVVEGVRRFARGLRPVALDEIGLDAAVASYARMLAEGGGVSIEVEPCPDAARGASRDAELAAYRILQEAITNAVRHAGARRIRVRLARDAEHLVASVTDDGVGFSPAAVEGAADAGLGLFGMRERAAYLGGEVVIESAPGAGTRVEVRIPFDQEVRRD